MRTAKTAARRRNTNLDALRAIAILMVLGRHAGETMLFAHTANFYTAYWARVGWAGVDLFFVLSGFLISGLLFSDYQEKGRIDVARFYIRRGLKIWPSFYALILIGLLWDAVLPGHTISTKRLWAELLFVQDYFRSIWGITWSLAVEEHFYLSLPLVLVLMIRRASAKPFAALPYLFVAIGVFSLVCRFIAGWRQDGVVDWWTCVFPTHLRMDGLMFGVLLCYYRRFRPSVFKRIVGWRGGWVLAAAAITALSILPVEGRHMHTWGFTLIYLAAGWVVARAVAFEGRRLIRIASGVLARIGLYSYSIYLWHIFVVQKILSHCHISSPVLMFWCALAGPILFGIAAAKAIEIPVLRFRDRVFASGFKGDVASIPAGPSQGLAEEQADGHAG
jgi:peptidoglycan/LPS O-acetylase OafA/YrhL